ncbi:2-isopropylmalate synthase [Bacillus cereus group sp. BfR-BA-01380]|uniref:2-isopropylmalate synthase n=1 Tax=Bacillus cereus group sp. BfR-BA-01380 TaxID=2920324 RepID=UPI001F5A3A8C|nr:2-isopropylmalate synthase [Bacillus cereus group sp. BfR-BA-01380]
MDETEEQQSYQEEFAPEISPSYRQDVHHPSRFSNMAFLVGIVVFAAVLLLLITFVYFR